jgi:chromosome partitioning protein
MVGRNNLSKNIGELIRGTYGDYLHIFDTQIPYSIRAAEVSATGGSIFAYEPNGKIAAAYKSLTEEVLKHWPEKIH